MRKAKMLASEALARDALSKSVAKQAVSAAEEVSAHHEKIGDGKDSNTQKEANASAFVQARIPDKPADEIKTDIKAALGVTPCVGASGAPEGKA